MPDISMCKNIHCPLKETCYRFTAKPSEYIQSYSDFAPRITKEGKVVCEYYWKVNPDKEPTDKN
jgi:hypothetical protein